MAVTIGSLLGYHASLRSAKNDETPVIRGQFESRSAIWDLEENDRTTNAQRAARSIDGHAHDASIGSDVENFALVATPDRSPTTADRYLVLSY